MLETYPGVIDFHSHILPEVDDGADSLETSISMLELSKSQGVSAIVSTSHYYNFDEDTESFIKRRDDAMYSLGRHINEHDMDLPQIILGAEVRLYPGLHKEENLDALCIENTRYILIEMPYDAWTDWMFSEIYAVITKGYIPVLAHIERYVSFVKEKVILNKLLSMEVYVQCNADSFGERKMRKFIKKLIKLNKLTVLGSDCHSMGMRKSHFDDACKYVIKKYGKAYLDRIMRNAADIINYVN